MRLQERISDYQNALTRLEALVTVKQADPAAPDYLNDAILQRFEFTYEMAWKALKLVLAAKDIDVRSPKETLAAALQQNLLTDGNA